MKGDKPFPVGRDNSLSVVVWRLVSDQESLIPLQVTVWPTEENRRSIVSAEFTSNAENFSLKNVWISIPCK
jgi:hypothetical protein